jgi:hypothetical protein
MCTHSLSLTPDSALKLIRVSRFHFGRRRAFSSTRELHLFFVLLIRVLKVIFLFVGRIVIKLFLAHFWIPNVGPVATFTQ